MSGERVTLSIPADAGHVAALRSFAFAIGRHEQLADDAVEDLKLALSEIASAAIESGTTGPIVIDIDDRERSLFVEVRSGISSIERSPSSEFERRHLVEALFPSVTFARDGATEIASFSVQKG
jgi:anti-sigma regulatory factor (Ser/Thr protein kinase)